MDDILDNMMCADVEDVPRFKTILRKLIKAGELKSYKAFKEDDKKKQAARKTKVGLKRFQDSDPSASHTYYKIIAWLLDEL